MLTKHDKVDLVTRSEDGLLWELILIVDEGEWSLPDAKNALVDKLDAYAVFARDGGLARRFPSARGCKVKILVQSVDEIPPWATTLLARIESVLATHGVLLHYERLGDDSSQLPS
jgi:hypothetical protein